ncbi:MAG TPA: peptide chain release factor N(5)-glutamine methyltransferase [Vicinamibacteria bacterium]|jgi:release factor glutamine methyltransferase
MTVAQLLAQAARELGDARVESPEWDAERLLRHVLAWDRATLVASPEASPSAEHAAEFRRLVRERARRIPLQHLTGTQAFWKQELRVTPDVLIPRPETELLVEAALELLRGAARPVIADVGTGSGCIALALAAERADAELHATDVSEAALAVARDNERRLGLEGRVAWQLGDLLEPVAAAVWGRTDLVVSNPPYVDEAERDSLAPEVRDHEPALALFPPGDALSVYRRLVPAAAEVLKPGGVLVVEIAPALDRAVAGLLEAAGFEGIEVRPDLAARPRAVLGRRPLGARSRVE